MPLIILDKVVLKDGTKGKVVEFDSKSPTGYSVCIGVTNRDGEYIRRWVRRDEIAEPKCETCGGTGCLAQLDAHGESLDTRECPQCHPAYSNIK